MSDQEQRRILPPIDAGGPSKRVGIYVAPGRIEPFDRITGQPFRPHGGVVDHRAARVHISGRRARRVARKEARRW